MYDADKDQVCSFETVAPQALAEYSPEDVTLYGWWQVELGEGAPGCVWRHNPLVTLALGDVDPGLQPAIVANELTDATPYGLYAQLTEADPVYVFGVAGTPDHLSGAVAPVTDGPVADGDYVLRTLHLLPQPPK